MKKFKFDVDDPYVIPGSNVLKNKLGYQDLRELHTAETEYTAINIRLLRQKPLEGNYDVQHLQEFHKYLFGGVYEWAGEFRTMDIAKPEKILGGKASIEYSRFEDIEAELEKEFNSMRGVNWDKLNINEK